jgi:hypothetical protein
MGSEDVIVPGVVLSKRIKSFVPVTPTIGRAAADSVIRQDRRKRQRMRVFILFGERLTSPSLIPDELGKSADSFMLNTSVGANESLSAVIPVREEGKVLCWRPAFARLRLGKRLTDLTHSQSVQHRDRCKCFSVEIGRMTPPARTRRKAADPRDVQGKEKDQQRLNAESAGHAIS